MYPYTEEVLAILNLEASLRMSSQREIRLKKQAQTESQKKELEETIASSWEQQRRYWWWKDRMLSSSTFLQRGFETWRSNERWYMHRVLVEDCVFRGGCCARGCGCCESPERLTSSVGKLAIGHCSIECACCVETRGGAIPSQEVCKDVDDLYGFSNLTKDFDLEKNVYRFQIYLAAIWGLGKGNPSRLPNDIKFNFCDLSVPTSEPACMQDDSSESQITTKLTDSFKFASVAVHICDQPPN
ncbi:hypothetical protein N7478_012488 [Penicillium angulare]|uniref:uncharacterized protein n=1 Tax=Penicillium angulare TaxID=116970 RepID=UPI0025418950|nr:uncharacterized protein N7478_012488 [Penicillium angulare]KAJ5259507.1 hypothetical protein N7478_012488 [Penicillium angulare]